jgi:hypothetical protein
MLVQDLIVKIIVDDEVLPKFNNFFLLQQAILIGSPKKNKKITTLQTP